MPSTSGRAALRFPPVPGLLVAATSIQGGAALAKSLFPALGAAGTTGVRVAFAALLLLAIFRPPVHRFRRSQWAALVPYGLALGGMNLSFYLALERIPLGLAVTLEFVGPLGVALLGSRRALDFLWVVLAGVGIVLLSPLGGGPTIDPLGMGLALLAGLFWGIYILVGGVVTRRLDHDGHGVAVGMVVAALAVLPFATGGIAGRLTPGLVGMGLLVAVLSSALPYTLELLAMRRLPSRLFGILMSLEPVIATLVGLVFLGELLEPLQWLAVACVCTASIGATRTTSRATLPPVEV